MTTWKPLMSTGRGRELGGELRRLRELAHYSGHELARKVGWNPAKISRMETGKSEPSEVDVAIFLTSCGVSGDELRRLLDMATETSDGYWYRQHDQQLPDELRSLVVQENTAETITDFELTRIPGLLQEEHYARALLVGAGIVPQEGIEPRVEARMARQSLLKRRDPPRCIFYIHEHAFRLTVGSAEVMRHQVWHLLMATSHPRCAIRVIPVAAGAHAGMAGPFRFLEFHEHKPMVYVENETSSLFLEEEQHIETYRKVLKRLSDVAMDAGQSREWLADLVSEYD
jgi:transcriptional regulator with XRE-family HTH domain